MSFSHFFIFFSGEGLILRTPLLLLDGATMTGYHADSSILDPDVGLHKCHQPILRLIP